MRLTFESTRCSIFEVPIVRCETSIYLFRYLEIESLAYFSLIISGMESICVYVFFFRKYRKNFDGTDGNTRMMDLSNTLFSSHRKMGRLFSLFLLEFVCE